jgi:SAM-dependent methyltransferase
MGYERCAELAFIMSRLEEHSERRWRCLDIGSGEGVFPTYLLKNTKWDITCIDKCSWVRKQHAYASRVMGGDAFVERFHVVESDVLAPDLPEESFDIITNISVIEHIGRERDSMAMEKSAKLLRVGGMYIFTTLINDQHPKEFYLYTSVYGDKYSHEPVFYQRHYDVRSLDERLIKPTGLSEKERIFFGDYDFQCFEHLIDIDWPWKPLKIAYQWATPYFARRFMTYRDWPINREGMHMNTSSGVIVVLERLG